MWLDELSPGIKSLELASPYLNVAGFLGFAPEPKSNPLWQHLGAFITNPISASPRKPAEARQVIPYPGGFLLHTGLPNPGLRSVLAKYALRWQCASLPIIVHLIAEEASTLTRMVRQLETTDNVAAIELGFAPDCSLEHLQALTTAAEGELPLVAALTPDQVLQWTPQLQSLPFANIHLSAPRGSIVTPGGQLVSGRLYGRSLLPHTLSALHTLAGSGLAIIASGGIYTREAAQSLLDLGASAISLDSMLWLGVGMDFFSFDA